MARIAGPVNPPIAVTARRRDAYLIWYLGMFLWIEWQKPRQRLATVMAVIDFGGPALPGWERSALSRALADVTDGDHQVGLLEPAALLALTELFCGLDLQTDPDVVQDSPASGD